MNAFDSDNQIRVTWLLPVKNAMPYLPETLASIEAQTYPHWEVIAWDNGSVDGTIAELRQWIPSRLPGKVIEDQPTGLGDCLRRMVDLAQTEFCARIDGDDINFPERLECQVRYLLENPDTAVVGSQCSEIDGKGTLLGIRRALPLKHEEIVLRMLCRNSISHPSVLFRRKAVIDVGNYKDLKPVEDYELWLRVANYFCIANLSYPLIYYRVHDNSVIGSAKASSVFHAATSVIADHASVFCMTSDSIFYIRRRPTMITPFFAVRIVKRLAGKYNTSFLKMLWSDASINNLIDLTPPVCYPIRYLLTYLLEKETRGILRSRLIEEFRRQLWKQKFTARLLHIIQSIRKSKMKS